MNIEDKKSIRLFWIIGLVLLAVLLALDFLVVHKPHFPKDGITIDTMSGFFALYGFVACFFLVILSKTLSINLKRKGSYYDDN